MEPRSDNGLTVAAPEAVPKGALATADRVSAAEGESGGDTRLDRLAMQMNVMVKVPAFRVQDLLSLENGTVVETEHEHTQDVPLACGGALLMWGEFEVVDERLALRITRLA